MTELLTKIPKNLTASPLMCDKREWIATAAMLAGSAISSLLGGAKARKAAQKAAKERTYRSNAEKAWYDKEYNTDYLDTKAGQNLMRRAQEVQDNYVRKVDGAVAVGGGTAASTAMTKESANKVMGDTIANVGAKDTARKQQVADQHHNNVMQQSQEREQAAQQTAQNTSDASQNMSNALMTAGVNQLGSQLEEGKSLKTSVLGSSPTSIDNINVTPTPSSSSISGTSLGDDGVQTLEQAVGESKQKTRWL